LLDAKHERDRQGPSWPGATEQAHPDSNTPQGASHVPATPTAPAAIAHERGDQSKRGRR
jgi:hypothetical protein